MKLITWNCQGAFRKKADHILQHDPDILVVQECEHPDKLKYAKVALVPKDSIWFGDNPHKGLGIFSYSKFRFKLLENQNNQLKYITPVAVTGGPVDFILFAIWANNRDDPDGQYVEQVWKAVTCYDQLLSTGLNILIGDFNSNTIWDRPRRIGNHSTVVSRLAEKNIHSVYHKHLGQTQGKEEHPTFFLYRNKKKPYHLDYCFASAAFTEKVKKVEIGSFKDWLKYSDHAPLIVNFEL